MEQIPIVFCCNLDYYPMFVVALYSLCDHVSKDCLYCVYVITDDPYIDSQNHLLNRTIQPNVEVSTILLEHNQYDQYFITKSYYSKETYYRLMIADLLPQFKKVIYLDCDICILDDVKKLYEVSLDKMVIGMAKAIIEKDLPFCDYVTKTLQLKIAQYHNAGVLLLNTEAFQEEHCFSQAISLIKEGIQYSLQDQDILNVVCQDRIKTISKLWNYRGPKDQLTNFSDIKIIHYISSKKPWNSDESPLSDIFWKYAKRTGYYEQLVRMKYRALLQEYI